MMCDELMTNTEHAAMDALAEAFVAVKAVIDQGDDTLARRNDLGEITSHIHALQHYVLSNVAARAFPNRFRLLGSSGRVVQEESVFIYDHGTYEGRSPLDIRTFGDEMKQEEGL